MANPPNDSLLAQVPPEALRRHCPSARTVKVRHRGVLYRQGDPCDSVFGLLEGQVTLSRLNPNGAQLTTAALSAGAFFGHALSGASEAEDTATAKGPVAVWRTPVREFQALLLHYPTLALHLVAHLTQRQLQLERRLEGFAFHRVEARLAAIFRELSGGFVTRCEHGFGQHLRLTQQELADLVGATRPVVSTLLNRLRDQGLIGYNREYVCVRRIEDLEQLIEG